MLILPLEGLEKTEVRQIARDLGLASADAPDSQEICWLPGGDYASFIEQKLGKSKSGDFICPGWNGLRQTQRPAPLYGRTEKTSWHRTGIPRIHQEMTQN